MVPIIVNVDQAYKQDGIRSFSLVLKFKNGSAAIPTTTKVNIPIYNSAKQLVWEFTTETVLAEKQLTILESGAILFPQVNSWNFPSGIYTGEVIITKPDDFKQTYLIVEFRRDIKPSKIESTKWLM